MLAFEFAEPSWNKIPIYPSMVKVKSVNIQANFTLGNNLNPAFNYFSDQGKQVELAAFSYK
jgi:hypothetical protein